MEKIFPYEKIRESQIDLINDISLAIKTENHLIAHAPTGIGKSAASLTAALKYALEKKKTIFIITPKHTQHKIIIETVRLINQKTKVVAADFIGKKWMCCIPGIDTLSNQEFSEYCREAKEKGLCDFYSNTRKGKDLTTLGSYTAEQAMHNPLHAEELCSLCSQKRLCPYEITGAIGKEANVIIGDYYHMLQPSIRKNLLLKTGKSIDDAIVIIDEAHNVPSRAREILTTATSLIAIKFALKEARAFNFEDALDKIKVVGDALNELYSRLDLNTHEITIKINEFVDKINIKYNYSKLIKEFESLAEAVREQRKKSYIGNLGAFMSSWLGPDYGFVRILKRVFSKHGTNAVLTYRCLDPSFCTKELIENAHSVVCMSGTLTPLEMYRDLMGFDNKTLLREYKNPFPEGNKLSLIIPDTTTKYTARDESMFKRIAGIIAGITNTVPGNTILFFPSYDLRDKVYIYFNKISSKTAFLEQRGLKKKEKNELLERFKCYKDVGAVLLATSSGNFGEGIDLMGDFLKGVVIIGLPLDRPNIETKALIDYYENKFKKGWDYGYILPAITRVMQNSGRCIRSETDRGIIAFVDERYAWESYRKCFPNDSNLKVTKNYLEEIDKFFKKN